MIRNLQSLRFVFIMLVVMSHIIGKSFDFGGECGVSFFFMLSGFILSYAYGEQVAARTFRHSRFLLKQLAKFYPLHVLMFFIMVLMDARLGRFFGWDQLIAQLLLLQSWVPRDDFYFIANGSSWFLSDLLFFYAVFPFVYLLLMRLHLRSLVMSALVVTAWYALLSLQIPEGMINPLLYAAPWTRLLDFSIGILVFRFYVSNASSSFNSWLGRQSGSVVTFMELALSLTLVASFFVYEHASLRFRCAAMFWLVLPLVLYFFVVSDNKTGSVTKLLHHSVLQWLGSISLEIFLVHWATMRLLYSGIAIFRGDEEVRLSLAVVLLTLAVICVVSYLTKRFFVTPVYTHLLQRINNKVL